MPKEETVIHSFPGIGKFTTETIKAYQERGWLGKMLTTIVIHKDMKLVKLINSLFPGFSNKLKNRNFSEVPAGKILLFPYKELMRLFAVRFFSLVTTDKIWEWAELSFDRWAARQLHSKITIVHAYEHAALATFKKATQLGIYKILEQTSQHYKYYEVLVKEQFLKYPELKSDYNKRISESMFSKRNERKNKEHSLADLIICNSSFTKKTLTEAEIDSEKIIIVPLAFPPCAEKVTQKDMEHFTFLYAGSLSIGKGTHLLLEIWKSHFANIKTAKLILAGKNLLPDSLTRNLPTNIEVIDYVQHDSLIKLYDLADVFVFPTLGDGFGMVITEAMSRGLPVIASKNSAGPDLIKDGHDGFLVDAGDQENLLNKMKWCLINRDQLHKIAAEALLRAKMYQWEDYRKKLISEISSKINE